MQLRLLAACVLALAALAYAAPVTLAGTPATVSVRIEGQDSTLLPTTTVTTSDSPAPVSGGNTSGTTAAAAIDLATNGNWDRQCFTQQLMGESHTFANNDYWAFWINNHFSTDKGICDYELGPGDQVLMLVDVADANFNPTVTPLALQNLPPRASVGVPFTVTVIHYKIDGSTEPVGGATVSGGGVSGTSDAAGNATLTPTSAGTLSLKAAKSGYARSGSADVCVSNGNDGTCGTVAGGSSVPSTSGAPAGSPGAAGVGAPEAYVAPRATFIGLRTGRHFPARRGPRTLAGHVDVGTSPLLAVKLRLMRSNRGRCSYFSGRDEQWHRTKRCGRGYFFRGGDSPDFSYLLPERLRTGRYMLEARAIATDHVATVTRVTFRVR
jgi:hypothetical protein